MSRQVEPCVSCGEDTSAGSPLFSDRLVASNDGARQYLCALCAAEARGSHEVHSDEEWERRRENLEKSAFAFGSFAKGGH
jgi:hypothetical protein